jgi:hypothetical protein
MSVITVGGLNLYDPNENIGGNQFQSYGFEVNPDNNNAVNQEDLIMYCNLRAFTRPRSYIMNSNSDGVKTQAVASAIVNFLKPNPEKNKFTTDWTELDASGRPNGDEMLGINSVQITYDTSYVPRVTITMTDVRGQALNEDPKDSPYGAFFNFPYPMFVLEVKGYYGKAVKYLLHLLKYSSRFDYSTGNFQITCEFVGFTYALLSDLNVQYGLVASQMELNGKTGKERLKEKFKLQIEKYKNVSGFSDDITRIINSDVYTLINLINKSKELGTFVESLNQDNNKFREKAALDNFIDVISVIYDSVTKENITNLDFNERVKNINGNYLFNEFPEYKPQLQCNIIATGKPTDFISKNVIDEYKRYFDDRKNIISVKNNQIQVELDNEVKSQLTNFLGFEPTIRNIMLIICNNFELFLDLLTETTQRAGEKRLGKYSKQIGVNPKIDKDLEVIYPWPALFNDDNYEICYFDDLPTLNINDYPEKEFVEAYLNATQLTNKLLVFTGGTTIPPEISNPVLYNPIHSQQYDNNNLKTPIFEVDINKCLIDIVEHALLISSNSWGNVNSNQVQNFGKVDADNLYKELGDTGIKPILPILRNNLSWLNDNNNNTTGNQPLGILQIINNNKFAVNERNNPFNRIKNQFYYIKDYSSDYLTDIVETEDIIKLKDKYRNLNELRFVPEIKNNTLNPGSGDYGFGSVNTENNGFIVYERNNKLLFPEEISLKGMFLPFMEERTNYYVFNKTKLNRENLLNSLKSVLIDLQTTEDNYDFWDFAFNAGLLSLFTNGFKVEDVLNKTPGVLDNKKEFVLFNGVHKTKMVCALNYLFFNDNVFLDPNFVGDYRELNKWRYYFPFTTNTFDKSFTDDIKVYNYNTEIFLSVYKELIESIIDIMGGAQTVKNSLPVYNSNGTTTSKGASEIRDTDLYYNIATGGNTPQEIIKINIDGNPSSFSNQDKNREQYSQIYKLIQEFFDADIQMVSKSKGLSDIYKDPLKYWTNNNRWEEQFINPNGFLIYDNVRYENFSSGNLIRFYLQGFRNKIIEIEEKVINNDKNNPQSGSNTVSVKTASDLKTSIYQTFKNINDKWVIDKPNGGKILYSWGLTGDVDQTNELIYNYNREFLFDHFFFVDRINRDIGKDLLLDFRVLDSYYEKVNSKNSLYSIIGELAKMNEMIFHPLTSYINFNGVTSNNNASIDGLFKPITTLDFQSTSPVFIMQYVGKNASYQYDNQNHLPDVVKIDFSNNTPTLNTPIFKDLNDDNTVNNPVAFFVDMGIKNQNMFKGISLDQAEFRETNESITVWDQLTSQKQNRSVQTIGNNIYPILSRRSYTCKVESLGNMMIQPTMYFYLRYIPLFSGLYLITKVSHSIQPNNVVTNFEGVRMSTINFPLVSEFISTITKEILEKGSSNVTFLTQQDPNFWDNLTNNTLKNRIITFYNAIKNRVDNPAVQAAMIAIAYKESKLVPKNESSYAGTTKYSVFNSFANLKKYTTEGPNDTETSRFINELKLKDTRFFNFIYGTNPKANEIGNDPKTAKLNPVKITDSDGTVITVYDDENGDGYKYRGRGYNQITGKESYELVKKDTGIDVVTNPDLLNNIDTATLALFYFMDRGAKGSVRQSTNQKNPFYQVYSKTPLSDFDKENYQKAYNTFFSINAGPGNSMEVHLNNEIKKNGYNDGYFILQSIYSAIVNGKIK